MYVAGLCWFLTNRIKCFFTSNARTVLRRNSFQFLYACRQVVVQKDRQFRTLNLYRARANEHQYPPVRVRWVCWVSCPLLGSVLTDPRPCASSNRHCVGPQGRTPEATTEANNWGVDYRSPSYSSKQKLHMKLVTERVTWGGDPNSNLHSMQNNQFFVAYIAGNWSNGRNLALEKN